VLSKRAPTRGSLFTVEDTGTRDCGGKKADVNLRGLSGRADAGTSRKYGGTGLGLRDSVAKLAIAAFNRENQSPKRAGAPAASSALSASSPLRGRKSDRIQPPDASAHLSSTRARNVDRLVDRPRRAHRGRDRNEVPFPGEPLVLIHRELIPSITRESCLGGWVARRVFKGE